MITKDILYSYLKEKEEDKIKDNKEPIATTYMEMREDMRADINKALRELRELKLIKVGKTLNDYYINVNNE